MKKWITALILFMSIGLAGCQNDSDQETPIASAETEKPKKIYSYTFEKEPENVTLIDPNTSEIIHTLAPYEQGYELDQETYRKEIEKLAKRLARGTPENPGYDRRMILDRIDEQGGVVKGSPLIILDENELVERIMAASAVGGEVELPITVTESGYDSADIPHLNEITVASYTTYFKSNPNRNKNIELSANSINNTIVGSGDHFSFNTVVGSRDEESGYQPAPEIISGELVMGIGGGVCQTSSTLFNALDQISLKILERHHHSREIGYVPKGRDATVSYGGLDFRFQNSTDVPILIKAIYGNGYLTIELRTAEKYKDRFKPLDLK
ncbi:VanW family protein [Sporosarcina thermotolerans]|uniref:VanW family protein n=1 Tax=Sporosarcina thermotolerans TaxID=633404 RepID=A0AAW9A5C6_9BACL|nr:VanW family protein [Sporosarcina thermotolerans]MDW0116397.1 VanW family protein [Sporosarcina thermotolerans]WHT48354.1 VanW family protein [Sporosarcina thermotolerans]